jgi:TonB-dependent starch-binding outer membrane protein SusC
MKNSQVKRCSPGYASLLLTAIFMALSLGTFAQQRTIRGTVTDQSGATLPGVSISIKGTTTGVASDINGEYTLNVPGPDAVLVFSYVGYDAQEIAVGTQTQINVTLTTGMQMLSEMVVVGYGTRMREELTGSVSTVSAEQLQTSTAPSVVSRLQGQVSGVTVTQANRPGGDAIIRIRGIGTFEDANPLYVIDGVPAGPGNNINPNDIESISILKDASSAAIYGTRGANGVIIITTKRGRTGQQPSYSFSVKTGINSAITQYDLLNTSEYAEAVWLGYKNRGETPNHPQYGTGATPVIPDFILPAGAKSGAAGTDASLYKYPDYQIFEANKVGTNWYNEIYRPALMQEYDLSVSGGGNNSNYAFSGSYLNEDGYIIHTNFERFTFRLNADTRLTNWLKIGESLQAVYIDENGRFTDNAEDSPISDAYRTQAIVPVYDISGVNFAGSRAAGMGNAENPVARAYRSRNNNGNWARMMGSGYAEINPFKSLTFRSMLGFNYGQWNYRGITLPNFEHSEPNRVNGINMDSNFSMQWNFTNTLNYNATLANNHRLNILLGTEAIENYYRFLNGSRTQFFSEDPNYMFLDAGEGQPPRNSGNMSEWSLWSQFARLNYDIGTKYFLEGTVRRDGSSRFAEEHRYGIFPAASAAWAISEENFMDATSNWLDMFKVRLGWGKSGNDRIRNYNAFTTFRSDAYRSSYPIDGSNTGATPGFLPHLMGNENTTWESTTTYNLGFDGSLFNRSVYFAFDTWRRLTTDMLFQLPIPQVSGDVVPPFLNIAEMHNQGFDLELGYRNQSESGRFTYNISANISRYSNNISKLTGDPDLIRDGATERQMVYTRFAEGQPYPMFYGYIVDGIFQTDAEAAAHPQFGTTDYNKPGHYKYRDVDGDGTITPDDRTWIGSPHPDFVGGLNFDFGYGNWDLNMFFYGSYGNKVVNYVSRWIDYGMFNGGLSKRALYESWGSPHLSNNADATLAMLDQNTISQYPSTAFLEDGSYLRMKNLRLGYTIPASAMQRIGFDNQRLKFYAQVSNLFTITNYRGLDPEINLSGNAMGLDRGAWPTARMVMFGINLSM